MFKKIILTTLCILFMTFAAVQASNIYVDKIKVSKSKILTANEIQQIVRKYEKKNLSINDLKQVIKKLNRLYQEKGFITARAILPKQEIENGTVMIKLIEGKVGDIYFVNNKHTNASYLKKRIKIKSGELVDIKKLEKNITYLNLSSDIITLADLKPGKEFGTTDIEISVREPKNRSCILFADNNGNKDTGLYSTGFTFIDRSLFGFRDEFDLTAVNTKGSLAGTLAYQFPINTYGTKLKLSYNYNRSDVITGDYKSLNINADYADLGINIEKPIKLSQIEEDKAFFRLKEKQSNTYVSNVKLLEKKIRTYEMGTKSIKKYRNKVLKFNQSITVGKIVSGDLDDFVKYNMYFYLQKLLAKKRSLNLKAVVQVTTDNQLPYSEKLSLGGVSTLRGYPTGFRTGDKGYIFNFKYIHILNNRINYFYFLDHGLATTYQGEDSEKENQGSLTSIGIGTNIVLTKHLSGEIVVGAPIGQKNRHPMINFSSKYVW